MYVKSVCRREQRRRIYTDFRSGASGASASRLDRNRTEVLCLIMRAPCRQGSQSSVHDSGDDPWLSFCKGDAFTRCVVHRWQSNHSEGRGAPAALCTTALGRCSPNDTLLPLRTVPRRMAHTSFKTRFLADVQTALRRGYTTIAHFTHFDLSLAGVTFLLR